MAATINEFIYKGAMLNYNGTPSVQSREKFNVIGSRYSTLAAFKSATIKTFNDFKTEEGIACFKPLTEKEVNAIQVLQNTIDCSLSIEKNFIILLTQDFIRKQINMLNSMDIEGLNANPILCRALKLNTPKEFIKYYAYAAISRSIVTSMGFLVQNLLLYSNKNVYDGKLYAEGNKTKWDLVIDKLGDVRNYIEVKSGPNDMDAAQVKHYADEIGLVEQNDHKAFIGITYGKKDAKTVSTSILETYLPDWKNKTLIGKELWDYISEDPTYHDQLMNTIQNTAEAFLGEESLIDKIEARIEELITIFNNKYATMEDFYNSLW